MRDKSLTELASHLGKDASWLAKKPLPHALVGGRKLYDVEECRAWIAVNVRERNAPRPTVEPAAPVQATQQHAKFEPKPPRPQPPKELTDVLTDPKATALDRAEATEKLAAWNVSVSISRGEFSSRDLEGMNKASEELRRSIGAYLEIEKERGQLIPRDTAKEVIGSFAMLVVQQLNNFSHTLAMQVELWNGDEKFRAASTEERAKIFRECYERNVSTARGMTCDQIEEALTAALSKDKNAEAVDV